MHSSKPPATPDGLPQGSGEDFIHEFFDSLKPALERYLFTLCSGNYEDVQDCLQETAVKLFTSSSSFRGQSSLKSWVYGIARNTAIDSWRRRKRRIALEQPEEAAGYEEPADAGLYDPAELLLRSEEQKLVIDALMSLPEAHRSCLYLHEIDGEELSEIARMLQLPEGTVKSRLHHGRRKFARAYRRLAEGSIGGGRNV